jgi:UDPglucose 6-dehydrogenase
MREAPSISIIQQLRQEGAKIKAHDPYAMENARKIFSDIEYCQDPYKVAEGSDILVIVTEWEEFRKLDLKRLKLLLKQPILIDGRNLFEPALMRELGFIYRGVGR